jgi:hypothetical protein
MANISKRLRHESLEPVPKRQRLDDEGDRAYSVPTRYATPTEAGPIPVLEPTPIAVDLSDDNYSEVHVDLDDEDDDDIPYTHSRSQSPEIVASHERKVEQRLTRNIDRGSKKPEGAEVISLDDDVSREYYVISDEEDEDEDEDDDDDVLISEAKQKPVSDQLAENMKSNNSNLNTAHCAVCFDSPEQTFVLPCGHIYCRDCVFKALSSMKTSSKYGGPCSLCRAVTSYKRVMVGIFKKKKKQLDGR